MARYSGRTTVSPVMGTRTSLDPFITWNDLAHDGASEAGAGSPRRYPTTTRREVLSGSRQGSCHGSDNQVVGEALRCPPHRTGRLPPRSEGRSCRCFHVRLTWRRRRPLLVRRVHRQLLELASPVPPSLDDAASIDSPADELEVRLRALRLDSMVEHRDQSQRCPSEDRRGRGERRKFVDRDRVDADPADGSSDEGGEHLLATHGSLLRSRGRSRSTPVIQHPARSGGCQVADSACRCADRSHVSRHRSLAGQAPELLGIQDLENAAGAADVAAGLQRLEHLVHGLAGASDHGGQLTLGDLAG